MHTWHRWVVARVFLMVACRELGADIPEQPFARQGRSWWFFLSVPWLQVLGFAEEVVKDVKGCRGCDKANKDTGWQPPKIVGGFGIPFLMGLSSGISAHHVHPLVMSQVEGFSPQTRLC